MFLYLFILTLLCAAAIVYHAQRLVHIYQLESYKPRQFTLHYAQDKKVYLVRPLQLAAALLAIQIALYIFFSKSILTAPGRLYYILPAFFTLLFAFVFTLDQRIRSKLPQKKPLQYTKRVRRFNAVFIVVLALVGLLVSFLMIRLIGNVLWACCLGVMVIQLIYTLLLYPLFMLCVYIAKPIEKAIARWYFNDGKKKLADMKGLIRIGITGSYGKTSTKMILASILSVRYKVFATPASVNTPMGITRLIRENMGDSYQVMIAEMGARQVGDIKELCELVNPQYGLITSVGPQHLETFKTIENVLNTKLELARYMDQSGSIFLQDDHALLSSAYPDIPMDKGLYGIETEGLYMSAWDITVDSNGSSFTLKTQKGETIRCTTRLLGRHNVLNVTGCAALAYALGLSLEEIAQGIAKVEPVEHRLQLIPAYGRTVIDDAYNSNPVGARAALDVLALFEGRKVIITPGLVELGEREAEENRLLGQAMADKVDVAILVARNAAFMEQGLLEKGFPKENIIVVGRLATATAEYNTIARAGDVLLFENDLPDHYEI